MKVGIQGAIASFHDVAAKRAFPGNAFMVAQHPTFRILADALAKGETDFAVMAIENSIAGSILPNYGLLERHGFKIIGETFLRIEHHLLALPGRNLADLKIVQSHPMALLQCEDFLARHPEWERLEGSDTAGSAKRIAEGKLGDHAAIASRLAAETYGLDILAENIESDRKNYTRFLTLCRAGDYRLPSAATKASLRFEAAHAPGSLASVLEIFSRHRVNLTKIQSVPVQGRPYQYSFHVDLEWSSDADYRNALAEFSQTVHHLIHFGEYARGERPVET